MRQFELIEKVMGYNPKADEAMLNRAYVYAMKAHGNQTRASGDPYFSHPLEVAAILTDLRLDDKTIAAALLHDTIEDTPATREEIETLFGPEIAHLVDGLTKLKKLDLVSKKAAQAENLRKLLLAVSDDIRVLLVKLADRLHNMRTLDHMRSDKRQRIAQETMDIYAPLAARMGMQDMREELEDIAFTTLQPEANQMITSKLESLSQRNSDVIEQVKKDLQDRLKAVGIEAEISGRQKRPYSIWHKMERKQVSFEQLSDIIGFRVIVATVEDCYRTLGMVHTTWPMVPNRFKDYISIPKQNDYRSLHTTVIGPGRQRVELQIRTYDMDEIAEYGIAAHALYKDAEDDGSDAKVSAAAQRARAAETRTYDWLRRLIEQLGEGATPEEFLENTKLELFHDQVFCFTPKGRLIALPRRANPIDFAYAVHTDVGNKCVGCKINGRIAPLSTELENGDEVEILTSNAQVPPAAWENLVITGKAKASIRRATRTAIRNQYAELGRRILERVFERAMRSYSDERLGAVLSRLARNSVEDVLAAVGRGEIRAVDVVRAVYPEWRENNDGSQPIDNKDIKRADLTGKDMPIPIRGLKGGLPIRFAPESSALPGERIIGILTPGEGVTIYPIHAQALQQFEEEPERWVDVRWDLEDEESVRFPTRIYLKSINEPGTLAQITQVIGEARANIDNLSMKRKTRESSELTIDLEVFNVKHLTQIMSALRLLPVVSEVERASD